MATITNSTLAAIRDHAGILLEKDHTNGSAAVILGLCLNLDREMRATDANLERSSTILASFLEDHRWRNGGMNCGCPACLSAREITGSMA